MAWIWNRKQAGCWRWRWLAAIHPHTHLSFGQATPPLLAALTPLIAIAHSLPTPLVALCPSHYNRGIYLRHACSVAAALSESLSLTGVHDTCWQGKGSGGVDVRGEVREGDNGDDI